MTRQARLLRWCIDACTKNAGLKLLSLVFAVAIFSLVSGAEDAQRSVFVGVVALLPPTSDDRVLVNDLPDRVRLTLRGSRSVLNAMTDRDLAPVQIDLRGTQADHYYFDLADFDIPSGFTIVQLAPASLPLRWAKRMQRFVPIEVRSVGKLPNGLTLDGPPSAEPSSVLVSGAEPQLLALQSISTEAMDISRLRIGSQVRTVQLLPPPPHSQYLSSPTVRVTLSVQIAPEEVTFAAQKVVPLVGSVGESATSGGSLARFRPSVVDVTLRGSAATIAKVSATSLVVGVDLQSLEGRVGNFSLPVQIQGLPNNVQIVRVTPSTVAIRLVTRR